MLLSNIKTGYKVIIMFGGFYFSSFGKKIYWDTQKECLKVLGDSFKFMETGNYILGETNMSDAMP